MKTPRKSLLNSFQLVYTIESDRQEDFSLAFPVESTSKVVSFRMSSAGQEANLENMIEEAARSIVRANRVLFFTGAGMSAESGIATFRSDSQSTWSGIRGKLAMIYFGTPLGWSLTPKWGFRAYIEEFYTPIAQAKPNPGHTAISLLEQTFSSASPHRKMIDIVTMNVDGLHQAAGSSADRVYEVHGTVRRHRCVAHGHPMELPSDLVIPPTGVPSHITVPTCTHEGCCSTPRPDCVLFGEGLPESTWQLAYGAVSALVPSRDVMFVIGTSGVVYPAASLPEIAVNRGMRVFELNVEPSSLSGAPSVTFIKGRVGDILPRIVQRAIERANKDEQAESF